MIPKFHEIVTAADDIDIIALENRIEAAYNSQITPYIDHEIEIAADYDFGTYFYYVWVGQTRLGCFYRCSTTDEWVTRANYRNGKFLYEPRERRFNSHKQAQAYIVRCWKGGRKDV